jgi:plasmid maintenance system antidote protein VapI
MTHQLGYAEAAGLLEQIPQTIEMMIRARGVDRKTVAIQAGVSASTLTRLLNGQGAVSLDGAIRLLRWLDERDGAP